MTALFADLRGFTTFSEGVEPARDRARCSTATTAWPCRASWTTAAPSCSSSATRCWRCSTRPARQPDHALRAVRAALAMQARGRARSPRPSPDWPRFRVGVNTGPALVGNIGSEALRGFNAMGDAVNVAARLQTLAEPGQVVIGEATLAAARRPASMVEPAGRPGGQGPGCRPVRAYVVTGMARDRRSSRREFWRHARRPTSGPSCVTARRAGGGGGAATVLMPRGRHAPTGCCVLRDGPGQGRPATPPAAPRSCWPYAGPGALLGELSAIDREPRSATVQALEPVTALVMPLAGLRGRTCRRTAGSRSC